MSSAFHIALLKEREFPLTSFCCLCRRDTQLWNATEDRFYIFQNDFKTCFYFPVGISILRPDWAVKCNCTRYVNRTTVSGHNDVDLYAAAGGGDNDFSLYMDPRTNLPRGIVSADGISNYFEDVVVGDPGNKVYDLDTSHCTGSPPASGELLQHRVTHPLFVSMAAGMA